ncbi:MAG: thioredoxin domain-containing protein [Methylotenera sp.]|nr:thioredoxin domain-containing protein [Methylotenera sp.]MDO9233180.1 thioredoxin domain-containing protein [Methylotenera sp.]MDO9387922.1 thioredoxin domain-containing protein [Methylotenera sp.]MDP2402493.1 thioredoxin domain-containing protein [Methylotenera sp.]MDP3094214.1 thioredoxin domain-containing protein [Methylotenera sp.]
MTNRLAEETSPYLLQHAQNPVQWYPWGEEALNLAKSQNKPILLSIGYSACHWCHVMAHESFEDDATAAIMNANFINIKVDREERPDIDQIYQTAHSLLSNKSGGWPLTVFLTPNQEPYFTGTYFPKTARYQLPGFCELIPRVAAYYHERKDDMTMQNRQLAQALARTIPVASSMVTADENTVKQGFEQLKTGFDFEYGGFGSAPKFPNPADVTLLLHQAKAGNNQAETMALQMLSAMAAGGIYDQLGGGFCRYSVDERWNIPHFEKMLYDNGQLLCLYADGWQLSKNAADKAIYARVIEETVSWLVREMRSPQGAFYSSLDADSLDAYGHSEEGAFYVWQLSEVKALLTPEEFVVASRCYGFDRAPNFEDPHSQTRAWHPYLAVVPSADEVELLSSARAKLFATREKRNHPGRDDKILTSWNALVIKGLSRVGRVFNRADWVLLAEGSVDFIREKLWLDDRLLATCKDDKAHLNAYLDDYAFLLDALIELMQVDYRSIDMQFAEDLAEALLDNFAAEDGGFYFTAHHHETLIHRAKQGYDNATPNGNGIAAVALQRLGHALGDARYLQAAERTLQAFDAVLKRSPAGCASLTYALDEYLTPPTMVILRGESAKLIKWRHALSQHYYPHHLFFYLDETVKVLPVTLQRSLAEDVNAWVCSGVECSQSVDDLSRLISQI